MPSSVSSNKRGGSSRTSPPEGSPAPPDDLIVLARLAAPFGVKGWFKLQPYGDDPERWVEIPCWWAARAADLPLSHWRPLTPKALHPHGRGWLVHFAEILDRTAAEALQGWYIAASRAQLPRLEEDEYYWGDLIGCAVVTLNGQPLGTVVDLLSASVHDVLIVVDGQRERLIPFVRAYIPHVDLAAKTIVADWSPDW